MNFQVIKIYLIVLCHFIFKLVFDKYKINWHDSDSDDDGVDSDEIAGILGSDSDSDSDY